MCTNIAFVGIEQFSPNGHISVYPNPTSDFVHVEISQLPGEANIQIFDMAGRIVFGKNISVEKDNHIETVQTSIFNSGTYYIQIIREGKIIAGERVMIVR